MDVLYEGEYLIRSLVLIAIVVSNLFGEGKEDIEKVSLQLKWKYQFQFAGFIAAKEKGFYKEAGIDIDLIEFDDQTDVIEELENGDADFAVSDSSLVYEAMKGADVVALMAIFQESLIYSWPCDHQISDRSKI